MNTTERIRCHKERSLELTELSDEDLNGLLTTAPQLHVGIGGSSRLLAWKGGHVFVKLIPLSDLERRSPRATANLFGLPAFYHYRVGSAGLGAWRELAAHEESSEWVLSGACDQFPLLHHARVLPITPQAAEAPTLDEDVAYWAGSPAVRRRLEGLRDATASLALFMEYVPQTLLSWLTERIRGGGDEADRALAWTEDRLSQLARHLSERGFLHMDGHFTNILTDGERLYLSDFGLALSSRFDLNPEEHEFLARHTDYDRGVIFQALAHALVTADSGPREDDWYESLRALLQGSPGRITGARAAAVRKYGPFALLMNEFYRNLQAESKSAPYPQDALRAMITSL
jgi:hypothetical protein